MPAQIRETQRAIDAQPRQPALQLRRLDTHHARFIAPRVPLLDRLRVRANEFLSAGNAGPLTVRLARRALNIANDLLGEPICSEVEMRARRDGRGAAPAPRAAPEQAPVTIYLASDSADRTPIEDLLKLRGIAYRVLDVSRDEATLSFLRTEAGREPPVVFVGDRPVGDLAALKAADASGDLAKLLRP